MTTVADILAIKGTDVWTVSPDDWVYRALEAMADREVGCLVVVKDGQIVGTISERDYARKIILRGVSSLDTPVREIMTSPVVFVTPSHSVEECMAIMTAERVRHLPVMDERRLAGIVSIGDLVRAQIADKDFMIDQLAGYISGR